MPIESLRATLSNPQRTYLWQVDIPNIAALSGGGSADTLQLMAQSTELPSTGIGTINIPWMGTAGINYTGKKKFSHQWVLEFLENEDSAIIEILRQWADNNIDPQTGLNTLANGDQSRATVTLSLLDTEGGNITRVVTLFGCFVQEIGTVALSYADEGVVKYRVTLSFDYWLDAPGAELGISISI